MEKTAMPLPAPVLHILGKLEAAGFRADVVGGAVRDFLLGRASEDYDITTAATPEEIKSVFSELRTIDTGLKHGTVSLLLDNTTYEITTYRVDGEYLDSRHPSEVFFTRRIEDDLSRRDLTVNAMAYSPCHGFTDLFGGIDDLKARRVRAVGAPKKRFTEDALRVLRALRFAARLDFEIEEKTEEALWECAPRLAHVSVERIFAELMKLLAGRGAYRVLKSHAELFLSVLPEMKVLSLPEERRFAGASAQLRFVALFRTAGAEAFWRATARLKTDSEIRDLGAILLENVDKLEVTRVAVKRALAAFGEKKTRALFAFASLLGISEGGEELLDEVIASGECYSLAALRVRGGDVTALGVRGADVGELLSKLLELVILGELPNEREALLGALADLAK